MQLDDSVDATAELWQLTLDVAGQSEPADMISRVTEVAVKFIGCAAADLIWITEDGQLRITASSDPGLSELTEETWRRWPHSTIPEHSTLANWGMMSPHSSYLQQLRSDTGIMQELIVPLVVGRSDHGYLRFLFTDAPATNANLTLIAALCSQAAITLDRAALLNQVRNLKVALESNRDIGAAVGVLMIQHQLTYSDGLGRLKAASQNANRKLREVATEVLYTGQLPLPNPVRSPAAGHRAAGSDGRPHSVGGGVDPQAVTRAWGSSRVPARV